MKKYIFLSCFLIIAFLLVMTLRNEWERKVILERQRNDLAIQKEILEREYQELKKLIEQGKTEEFLEREARVMLGLKRIGEQMMLVVPPNPIENAPLSETEVIDIKQRSLFASIIFQFQNWWRQITGNL